MVFYDIELIKTDPNTPPAGIISFQSGGIVYESELDPFDPNFSPNVFFFEVLNAQGQGRLGYLNANDPNDRRFTWKSLLGDTFFPPEPTFFEIGDCIHVFVNTSQGAGASLRIIDTNGNTELLFLEDGQDIWILWQGNNSNFSNQPCCVHPDTKIKTPNGLVKISDIRSGDLVIDHKGRKIEVRSNIKSIPSKSFVNVRKGSLGDDVPSEDLYIRPGHPILLKGREVDPKSLIKKNNDISLITMAESTHVWTLCTDKRGFVIMNEVPVCTWEYPDWKRFSKANSIVYWEY